MGKLLSQIPKEDDRINMPNSINQNYATFNTAFDRVKCSNEKYDKIIRGDKSIYGYVCQICGGGIGYHLSIQNIHRHDFIKGNYQRLE
jgi:translation initiation factor 2 beta subunit (eIF-2beta)/eIF-5